MNPSGAARSSRMRRAVSAAGALALAFTLSWPASAHAQSTAGPSAQDGKSGHFAAARIATDDWCLGKGPIGAVDTDHDTDGAATADWKSGHGADRWGDPRTPGDAASAVRASGDGLKATATVEDIRYRGGCAEETAETAADSAGESAEPTRSESPPAPSDLSIEVDAIALRRVTSVAAWSPDTGASAKIRVEGLQILGQDVRFGRDRVWTETFPTDGGEITATAEKRVTEAAEDGADAPGTASAKLLVRFDITEDTPHGAETTRFRLDFAAVGAHSDREVHGAERRSGEPSDGSTSGDAPQSGRDRSERSPGHGGDRSPAPSPGPSADPSATPGPSRPAAPGADPVPTRSATPPPRGGGDTRPGGDPLPVTGGALVGLVGAALLSVSGGGAAMYLARPRKSALDSDD